jgi:hypothetical protein
MSRSLTVIFLYLFLMNTRATLICDGRCHCSNHRSFANS